MNYTTENAIETPVNAAPISAILDEIDSILSECLSALDKLNTCVSGTAKLEEIKSEPKCMRECVTLTADKARMVRGGILHVMEALGI